MPRSSSVDKAFEFGAGYEPQGQAVAEELRSLDMTQLTPLEAINKLYELQQRLKG